MYIAFNRSISIDFVNIRKLVFINVYNKDCYTPYTWPYARARVCTLIYMYICILNIYFESTLACELALVPQEKENRSL